MDVGTTIQSWRNCMVVSTSLVGKISPYVDVKLLKLVFDVIVTYMTINNSER